MRIKSLVITAALLFAAGCTDESQVSESQHGVTSTNRIGLNRIALNRIALNRIALNRIALNTIATSDLLNSPDCQPGDPPATECGGREVLEYLVSCAFPEGVTFEATADDGTTYTFDGSIGLAPRWETRRLTLKEQRWISACMLARVNNAGVSLLISLRGPHDALAVSTEESNEYALQEGAFYGQIFGEQQEFYACRGSDLYAGNFGDVVELRACAQPTEAGDTTLCGMTYTGECDAFNVERACAGTSDEGYYERCHTYPSKNGKWHDEGIATRFEEAITVYVQEDPDVLP